MVPIPPNQETVNTLFGTNITTVEQMEAWIAERRPDLKGAEPANGEEMSMTRVGKDLYEKVETTISILRKSSCFSNLCDSLNH